MSEVLDFQRDPSRKVFFIEDVDSETLGVMINAMYTDELSWIERTPDMSDVAALLEAAHKYQFKLLKVRICCLSSIRNLLS